MELEGLSFLCHYDETTLTMMELEFTLGMGAGVQSGGLGRQHGSE